MTWQDPSQSCSLNPAVSKVSYLEMASKPGAGAFAFFREKVQHDAWSLYGGNHLSLAYLYHERSVCCLPVGVENLSEDPISVVVETDAGWGMPRHAMSRTDTRHPVSVLDIAPGAGSLILHDNVPTVPIRICPTSRHIQCVYAVVFDDAVAELLSSIRRAAAPNPHPLLTGLDDWRFWVREKRALQEQYLRELMMRACHPSRLAQIGEDSAT